MRRTQIFFLGFVYFGAATAYSQITLNSVPSRGVGTPALTVTSATPNLVEGRELYAPQAVALDTSVSPPILYVSDYGNNRVLAWKNASAFTTGQKADMAIGQPDLVTTFAEGPGASSSNYSTGLSRPSGLAVDTNGNLYVVDGGNNRILRYPKPFSQTGQFPVPNLAIGQLTLTTHGANYPSGSVNPQGLYLASGSTVLASNLAFDSSGNLWVIDTGNVRILRFSASDLAGTGGGLAADLELGQLDLASTQTALSSSSAGSYYKLNQFISPAALAFDPSGNLFVGDLNRVLVFAPPFSSGMSASSHILGVYPVNYTYPTAAGAKQALLDQTAVYAPSAIFFLSGGASGVGVADAAYHRIMIFDVFANWPADTTPPLAKTILGQPNTCPQYYSNQTCKYSNNANPQPSNSVFSQPAGVAYTGTDLFLVDAGNNRVLDLPQQGATFGPATRVLGQDYFNTNSPNLIEGREFRFTGLISSSSYSDAGMAIDASGAAPHLYVADSYNNRVLGFYDLRKFQNGTKSKADIVLGQADFTTALVNYPSGDANKPTSSGLYRPVGLLVDSRGNLYVADSLNGRVLRFPAPFAYAGLEAKAGVATGPAPEPADLVLGQKSFTDKIQDPTAATMAAPYGLAFTPACNVLALPCSNPNGLLVSDQSDNRVLYIPFTANGTFVAGTDNGKAATVVFGQVSFNSVTTGSTLATMNAPHHISSDANGYLYVADTGNSRVLIFPDPNGASTPQTGEQASAAITGLSSPESVFANPATGEIWVANSGSSAGTSLRYANYQSVLLGLGSISSIAEASGSFLYHPLLAIQDQYGDLFVADDAHRVAIYYPGLNVCNGASFLPSSPTSSTYPSASCMPNYDATLIKAGSKGLQPRPLAPGAIATILPCANCVGDQFGDTSTAFSGTYPVPTALAGVEVLVDGVLSPLYYVGAPTPPGNPAGQINFIVPMSARTSGSADVEVVQASTGQVLGATQVPMNAVAPGAFPYPGGQSGATVYAAAVNQDGTINSSTNPAQHGQAVSLYLTGQGYVSGAPADGVPATAAMAAPAAVTVYLNGVDVNSSTYGEPGIQHVLYSGLNQYPGVWQVNVLIPASITTPTWFAVVADGLANWDSGSGFKTYIYVK